MSTGPSFLNDADQCLTSCRESPSSPSSPSHYTSCYLSSDNDNHAIGLVRHIPQSPRSVRFPLRDQAQALATPTPVKPLAPRDRSTKPDWSLRFRCHDIIRRLFDIACQVLAANLTHPAIFRRLVGPPTQQPRAMPKLAATDVVGAEFGDEPGVEPGICVSS